MANQLNREGWLHRMAELQRTWFREHKLPIVGRITITMATVGTRKRGNCRPIRMKDEKLNHIFISAYENDFNSDAEVAGTIAHELLHATVGVEAQHGKLFKDGMKAIGLVGLATQAQPGPEFNAYLEELCKSIGPIPKYGVMRPRRRKRVITGPTKFQCSECKLTVPLTVYAYELAGPPKCWNEECDNCGKEMIEKEIK